MSLIGALVRYNSIACQQLLSTQNTVIRCSYAVMAWSVVLMLDVMCVCVLLARALFLEFLRPSFRGMYAARGVRQLLLQVCKADTSKHKQRFISLMWPTALDFTYWAHSEVLKPPQLRCDDGLTLFAAVYSDVRAHRTCSLGSPACNAAQGVVFTAQVHGVRTPPAN